MSANYYGSSTVKVFPSTGRVLIPDGKFTSEINFTNIVNCLTDDFKVITGTGIVKNDGYLLSNDVVDGVLTVKAIIHGYYFELTGVSTSQTNPLWLGICIRNTDDRLVSFTDHNNALDTSATLASSEFSGLYHTYSDNDVVAAGGDFTNYWLQVYDGTNWINKVRIDADAISYAYNVSSSGENTTIKDKVDDLDNKKQAKLVLESNSGLVFLDSSATEPEKLRINQNHLDHLNTIESTNAGVINNEPAVMKVANGIPSNNTAVNLGKEFSTIQGQNYGYAQNVYVTGGILKQGQKMYISTESPIGKTISGVNTGDIWFRYSGN